MWHIVPQQANASVHTGDVRLHTRGHEPTSQHTLRRRETIRLAIRLTARPQAAHDVVEVVVVVVGGVG